MFSAGKHAIPWSLKDTQPRRDPKSVETEDAVVKPLTSLDVQRETLSVVVSQALHDVQTLDNGHDWEKHENTSSVAGNLDEGEASIHVDTQSVGLVDESTSEECVSGVQDVITPTQHGAYSDNDEQQAELQKEVDSPLEGVEDLSWDDTKVQRPSRDPSTQPVFNAMPNEISCAFLKDQSQNRTMSPTLEVALENTNACSTAPSPDPKVEPQAAPSPMAISPRRPRTPANIQVADATDVESPQIGTTLLRRESLRRKESPKRRSSSRKVRSPQKKQLKKRDTLQEREILQSFNEGTSSVHQARVQSGTAKSGSPDGTSSDMTKAGEELLKANLPSNENCEKLSDSKDVDTVQDSDGFMEKAVLEPKPQVLEKVLGFTKIANGSDVSDLRSSSQDQDALLVVCEDEINANANRNVERESVSVSERADLPTRKTRSGARFSDDASMLQDFLNRSQARKAAKDLVLPSELAKVPQQSPRRSPRKALGPHSGRNRSPRKSRTSSPRDIAVRPCTPQGKPKLDITDLDDVEDEVANEPASCRRSTRTRLPPPSKTPPGAPSFIPVRRADGADPVVLQKSQAQEVAIVTRANTRRNKGQSKAPLLALQDIAAGSEEVVTSGKPRISKAKGKGVAWAETLASYQDAQDAPEDVDDQRPKVRRMRGLGAMNGTPAAKRTTTVVSSSNGTPAPKRRGKVQ